MQNVSISSSQSLISCSSLILRRAIPTWVFYQPKCNISINSGINRGLRASRAARAPRSLRRRQRKLDVVEEPNTQTFKANVGEPVGDNTESPLYVPSADDSGARDLWPGGIPTLVDSTLKANNAHEQQIVERRSHKDRNKNQRSRREGNPRVRFAQEEEPDLPLSGIPYTTAASTFIFGRRSVIAALQARRRKLYNLYWVGIQGDRSKLQDIFNLAESQELVPTWKSRFSFDRLKASIENPRDAALVRDDGVCLEVSPLPQPPLTSLGQLSREKGFFDVQLSYQSQEEANINGTDRVVHYRGSDWRAPCLIWLHGVVDAGNVGAILRSAIYFGIDGVILSSRATASMTDGAVKSSAGAAEFIPLFKVNDSDKFVEESQAYGWTFYATVAPHWHDEYHGRDYRRRRIRSRPMFIDQLRETPVVHRPSIIVLGNEEQGLPDGLIRKLDYPISVGGRSKAALEAGVESLNVSVAAAILCEKFLAQPKYSNESRESSRLARRLV